MNLQYFESLAKNKKIDELENVLEKAFKNAADPTLFLINVLTITDVPQVRNEVALLLADNPDERAIEPLVEMILSERTPLNKANMLTALAKYDYIPYSEMLFNFLIDGYFEISRKSYLMLEEVSDRIPDDIKSKGIDRINEKIENLEEEIEFLRDAMEMLLP